MNAHHAAYLDHLVRCFPQRHETTRTPAHVALAEAITMPALRVAARGPLTLCDNCERPAYVHTLRPGRDPEIPVMLCPLCGGVSEPEES